jgi:hypothetical protein
MLESLLRQLRSHAGSHRARAEAGELNLACSDPTFVLKHARAFLPTPLPPGLMRGCPKHCYFNAADAAVLRGLVYVEGYALHASAGVIEHAWCSDGAQAAYELTLRDLCAAYFGIPVRREHLLEHFTACCESGIYEPIFQPQHLPRLDSTVDLWLHRGE